MNKIFIAIILGIIAVSGIWYLMVNQALEAENLNNNAEKLNSSPLNTTYLIEGEEFTLIDGLAEKEISKGSATKNSVSVFGEPAFGDIDGDGDDDAVLLLVNNSGGSGMFYYAAIAANIDGKYQGTDTIFLGDRIAPQNFSIDDGRAKINYAERKPGEAMIAQPSVGKSLHLQFDKETLRLIEVAVDFAGEANPEMMTLYMKPWTWIKTTYNDDTEIIPEDEGDFVLTLNEDKTFSATTDCNAMRGSYEVEGSQISFGPIASTKMFCEGSQEQEFSATLEEAVSFSFTGRGELIFDLKLDSGSATFR